MEETIIDLTVEYRPCSYKSSGCRAALTDEQAADHQSQCVYQPVPCPKCTWKGTVPHLHSHFKVEHPDFVEDRAELTLKLEHSSKGLLMVKNGYPFLIEYSFDASDCNFEYDVRLCSIVKACEATCRLQLLQDSDSGDQIGFIVSSCKVYNSKPDFIIVNLRQFGTFLQGRKSVRVRIELNVGASKNLSVDNDALICQKCLKCLVGPDVFESKNAMLCRVCAKDEICNRSQDELLLELVKKAVYTCPWPGCQFTGKADVYQNHESRCSFRMYDCLFPAHTCWSNSLSLSMMISHLKKKHSTAYLPRLIGYKMTFCQISSPRKVITTRDRVLVLLEHVSEKDENEPMFTHQVKVSTTPCELRRITGTISFAHSHCKVQSEEFTVGSTVVTRVGLNELPPCFGASERLSVTVNIKAE